MLLENRIVVISGVGPGMGVEIARAAVREGGHVVLGARNASYLEKVAAELAPSGRRVLWQPTDITDVAQCEALARRVEGEFGRIDALVNNAYRPTFNLPFMEMRAEHWRTQLEVNYIGALQMIQAFVPLLRASGGGAIANISTIGGRRPRVNQLDYGSSKAALQSATRNLALELGKENIRVNTLAMGWMQGPPVERGIENMAEQRGIDAEIVRNEVRAKMALGEIPDDADCANAVVFMVSEYARGITGAILDVNGGEFMP